MTRKLDVRLHDTTMGIWQDDPNDPTFKTDIFAGIRGLLWRRGWKVGDDPACHHRSLRPSHRLARKGNLIASLQVAGRSIEFKCWAETWPKDNQNGHRYDFNKRDRLDYIDRLSLELEERAIIRWLEARASLSVSRSRPYPSTGRITALEYIEQEYAESWHSDKALGRPVPTGDYNRKSADGFMLEHGATVWTTDEKGRLIRGTAFYHINNMWWVVTGRHALENKGCHDIYARRPDNVRRKRNGRSRRFRLERELANAIRREDEKRAELLQQILFSDQPIYRIWSRKWNAYYGPNYSGYTTDEVRAGRYTLAEARREVRRVSHILHAIGPDGRREDFAGAEDAA
ncbi:hypothetical protein J2X65_003201 [Ancylobacter sp. 3268]|uniref:hypothetical protein n=1 Tax=Ancylobacter sp. 3268 TaxID=2817752 RepID=UPI0028652EC7|nr:hypothetical protein [Ancylobacter sp. 3268]MDR6953838.1 hypothetical protein [Ancylobacter sp. 3268]